MDLEQNHPTGAMAVVITIVQQVCPACNTNIAASMQKEDKAAEMTGKWEKENQRLASEAKHQTDLAQHMAEMMDQMNKKIKEMEREIRDLQAHRDTDIEKAEIALENTYNHWMINNSEKVTAENDAKIRLLEHQLAKYRRDTSPDSDDVKQELEFQNIVWK